MTVGNSRFLTSYDPTWGRVKSITHPAPGNQGYEVSAADGYFDYFGAAAGDRAKGYYAFDLGLGAPVLTELQLRAGRVRRRLWTDAGSGDCH